MEQIIIDVQSQALEDALGLYIQRVGNGEPLLMALGEDIVARAKGRFSTSTDPDGLPWAPNARSTVDAAVAKKGGFKKDGQLNAKGQAIAGAKKPLIQSGDLSRAFWWQTSGNELTVGNSMKYAVFGQFGTAPHDIEARNKKALSFNGIVVRKVHHPGTPARPFFPIRQDGSLYASEERDILATINDYLAGA